MPSASLDRRESTLEDPHHPIIEEPWQYRIAEFRYLTGIDGDVPCIDLHLVNGDSKRRLRFSRPQDLVIERGCFPEPTGGMVILDTSARQMEGMNVQVTDREGTRGAITFWAESVTALA